MTNNMIYKIVNVILLCLSGLSRVNSTITADEFSAILQNITTNYDKRLRPNFNGAPLRVGITAHILAIGDLSETGMAFTIDLFLRQYWRDPRLVFKHNVSHQESITIESEFMNHLWTPDIFFINEYSSSFHEHIKPNRFFRCSPDGNVWTSSRYTVVASCPMHLARFPHDVQICRLGVQSYGYTTDDIKLYFEKENKSLTMDEILLPQFRLLSIEGIHELEEYSSGNYSTIYWDFTFGRRIGYYIMQIYLPCTVLVIISFMVFWFPPQNFGDRLALGITTMLTITLLISSVNSNMPKFSYVKAIDFYLLSCFILCFFALILSALNARTTHKSANVSQQATKENNDKNANISHLQDDTIIHSVSCNNVTSERLSVEDNNLGNSGFENNLNSAKSNFEKFGFSANLATYRKRFKETCANSLRDPEAQFQKTPRPKMLMWRGAKTLCCRKKKEISIDDDDAEGEVTKIDRFCRITFPSFFLLFNIIYWIVFTQ